MLVLTLKSTVLERIRCSSVLVFLVKLRTFVMKLLVAWFAQFRIGLGDTLAVKDSRYCKNSVLLLL